MGQGGVVQEQPGITNAGEERDLDYDSINAKMSLIQQIIDQYFLYEEDLEQVEDYIYIGMMAGLEDPYSAYYTQEDLKSFRRIRRGSTPESEHAQPESDDGAVYGGAGL